MLRDINNWPHHRWHTTPKDSWRHKFVNFLQDSFAWCWFISHLCVLYHDVLSSVQCCMMFSLLQVRFTWGCHYFSAVLCDDVTLYFKPVLYDVIVFQVNFTWCHCISGQFYVMMSPQDVLQAAGQRVIVPRAGGGVVGQRAETGRTSRDDRRRTSHNEGQCKAQSVWVEGRDFSSFCHPAFMPRCGQSAYMLIQPAADGCF